MNDIVGLGAHPSGSAYTPFTLNDNILLEKKQ